MTFGTHINIILLLTCKYINYITLGTRFFVFLFLSIVWYYFFYVLLLSFLLESRPKRTRGHNRGEAARRLVARHNQKLTVSYREGEVRVLGDNAGRFATEIGIIIRHHAPLQRRGWCKVLPKERDSLYARLQV